MEDNFNHKRQWGPTPKYERVLKYQPPVNNLISVAGPCSVESESQINIIAGEVAVHGTRYLRGGVFRAGTYPGEAFGLNEGLMKAISKAAKNNGMKCILEVLDYSDDALALYSKYADCFQVGARQMQNYTLLHKLGSLNRTVFLKRNTGSTLDEFLGAAEHILQSGHGDVVLIERGSSTHMNHVRWDLSVSIIPAIKNLTKIPIIIDASHGTGRRDLVEPMTLAGIAAGADGYLVETHPEPEKSISDSDQSFPLLFYGNLARKINRVREAIKNDN